MADIAAGGNTAIQVKGARELAKALRQAGADMQDLKDANRRAADIVAPAAKAKAPRRTGRLAASVRAGATQKAGVVRAGRKSVPYAGSINYGWPKRHIKATLFINKAAKATEPQWTEAYRAAVERIIQDIYSQTQGAAQ